MKIDEGFDETMSTLAFRETLRARLGVRKVAKFSDLVDDNMDRRAVAKTFLQLAAARVRQTGEG